MMQVCALVSQGTLDYMVYTPHIVLVEGKLWDD